MAIDQELKDLALAELRTGMSVRDAAEITGVGKSTLERWRQELETQERPPRPEDDDDDEEDDEENDDDDDDDLEQMRQIRRELKASARAAKKVGNTTAQGRALAQAAVVGNNIARIKAASGDTEGSVTMTLTEIAEVEDRLIAKAKALSARPVLCAHCNRQLSIDYGTGAKKDDE